MAIDSPGKCVVLVPVGGSIEPGCESGLRTLEQRGYPVRRIRGYSAIDVGRNQMATDALRDGFQELFWIDSDVAFNPDDVDRLRSHQLPFVCGVYPKKSRREFACNFLPGTERVVFGTNGGLTEILYAGFGFVYSHRSLYETIRSKCELSTCNQAFGSGTLPFFMPFAVPHGEGQWYLGEDYAFCERARRSGFKVMVDTRIRLWHVGSYTFGWEDAGSDKERYANYTFHLSPSKPTPEQNATITSPTTGPTTPIQILSRQHPWPKQRPDLLVPENDGWLYPETQEALRETLSPKMRVVVELGSWTGLSTRYIADCAPEATVIAIDHWRGSPEHAADPKLVHRLERLYEEFLAACWEYRGRIIPIRAATESGLREVFAAGIKPDLIFVDADHSYESAKADTDLANQLFPGTILVGDDWTGAACGER